MEYTLAKITAYSCTQVIEIPRQKVKILDFDAGWCPARNEKRVLIETEDCKKYIVAKSNIEEFNLKRGYENVS